MCYGIINDMVKDTIATHIKKILTEKGYNISNFKLTPAGNIRFGDFTTNIALSLAQELKKNPMSIAKEIAESIVPHELIAHADVAQPGFINLWLPQAHILESLCTIPQNNEFGKSEINKNKKVIVEYSSPNIAKPFTVGHLRSTIIGDAVANLLEYTGYTVFRDNHVGDWGTQFGKLIYAIKTWGDITTIEQAERPVKVLVDLYIKFHEEAEKTPALEDEGRNWFSKLEKGDTEARKLWEKCIEWSWKEFNIIYTQLGIQFTENNGRGFGESFFEDKMQPVLQELQTNPSVKNLFKESDGAQLVFFPDEKYPPLMILKQDGSTLYSTRDLATDKFRLENPRYGNDIKIINEVGIEQSLYFNQLFETEKLLGWVSDNQRIHVKHGMYRFKDRKMSTRKGNVIWLEEVLAEAKQRAFNLTPQSLPNRTVTQSYGDEDWVSAKNSVAAQKHRLTSEEYVENADIIGIGAIKWNDLKRSSHLDIVFDWDEILNMDGNSGPYIQYTYVRCTSVLKKAEYTPVHHLSEIETSEEESQLMRELITFPAVVYEAAENLAPHHLCAYLFEIAQWYNLFYQKHHILKEENQDIKRLRLTLTGATSQVLANGLKILGIKTVEKM